MQTHAPTIRITFARIVHYHQREAQAVTSFAGFDSSEYEVPGSELASAVADALDAQVHRELALYSMASEKVSKMC